MATLKSIAIRRETALNELVKLLDVQVPQSNGTPLHQVIELEIIVDGLRRQKRHIEHLEAMLEDVTDTDMLPDTDTQELEVADTPKRVWGSKAE